MKKIASRFENLNDAARAAIEVFVISFFGLLPLAILIIRENLENKDNSFALWENLSHNLSGGQLYLYVFSMFGTLMWLGFFDWRFPYPKIRIILAFVVVTLGFFIVSLANFDPTFTTFVEPWVINGSYITYTASIILYWLLLWLLKRPPKSARESLDEATQKVARDLANLSSKK